MTKSTLQRIGYALSKAHFGLIQANEMWIARVVEEAMDDIDMAIIDKLNEELKHAKDARDTEA